MRQPSSEIIKLEYFNAVNLEDIRLLSLFYLTPDCWFQSGGSLEGEGQ